MKKLQGYLKFILLLFNPYVLFGTLLFNFYKLPFKQAIKLPIWLYKPKFYNFLKGKVIIDTKKITPGMIRLGFMGGKMYPNNGIQISNEGKIIFKGKCCIGNNSFFVIGPDGELEFGEDFIASTSLKITCFINIKFGTHVRVGFQNHFMDTNFHPLFDMEKKKFKRAYGSIEIGDYNWFAMDCCTMHSVSTPERCIFGARSILTRGSKFESYCVHGGNPIRILSRNIIRIYGKDYIKKYSKNPDDEIQLL